MQLIAKEGITAPLKGRLYQKWYGHLEGYISIYWM